MYKKEDVLFADLENQKKSDITTGIKINLKIKPISLKNPKEIYSDFSMLQGKNYVEVY